MNDQPRRSDTPGEGAPHDRSPGMARWQKLTAVIGVALLVTVVVLLAGGEHSPARHAPAQQPVEDGSLHDPSRWDH